jgi:hypothetical protein
MSKMDSDGLMAMRKNIVELAKEIASYIDASGETLILFKSLMALSKCEALLKITQMTLMSNMDFDSPSEDNRTYLNALNYEYNLFLADMDELRIMIP